MGSRLKSKSKDSPKGLLKINNKYFFDYVLNSIKSYKPSSIHFCLGYKREIYIEYINKLKYKAKITYSSENPDELLGTGGAIKNACKYLNNDFIVQYGDSILNFDYNNFFNFHLTKEMPMTMTILNKSKTSELPNLL